MLNIEWRHLSIMVCENSYNITLKIANIMVMGKYNSAMGVHRHVQHPKKLLSSNIISIA